MSRGLLSPHGHGVGPAPNPNAHLMSMANLNVVRHNDRSKKQKLALQKKLDVVRTNLQRSALFGKQLMKENQELTVQVRDLRHELEEVSELVARRQKKYNRLEEETQILRTAQADHQIDQDKIRDYSLELARLRAEHARFLRVNRELRSDLDDSRSQVRGLREDTSELSTRVAQLTRLQSDSSASRQKSAALHEELARVADDIEAQNEYIEALRGEKKKLTQRMKKQDAKMKRSFAAKMSAVQNSLHLSLEDMRVSIGTLRRHFVHSAAIISSQMHEEVGDLLVKVDACTRSGGFEIEQLRKEFATLQSMPLPEPEVVTVVRQPPPAPAPVVVPVVPVVVPVVTPPVPKPVVSPPKPKVVTRVPKRVVVQKVVKKIVVVNKPASVETPEPEPAPVVVEEPDVAPPPPMVPREPRPEEGMLLSWMRHFLMPCVASHHLSRDQLPVVTTCSFEGQVVRFQDGMLFCAVVCQFDASILDWDKDVAYGGAGRNCRMVFDLAWKYFGVQKILDAEPVEERAWKVDEVVTYTLALYTALRERVDAANRDYLRDIKGWSLRLDLALKNRIRTASDLRALESDYKEAMRAHIRLSVVCAQICRFYLPKSEPHRRVLDFAKNCSLTSRLRQVCLKIRREKDRIELMAGLDPGESPEQRQAVIRSFNEMCNKYFAWSMVTQEELLEKQDESEIVTPSDHRVLDDYEDDEELIELKRVILEENRAKLRELWKHYNMINFGKIEEVESVYYTKEEIEMENEVLGFALHGLVSKRIKSLEEEVFPE